MLELRERCWRKDDKIYFALRWKVPQPQANSVLIVAAQSDFPEVDFFKKIRIEILPT